MIENSLSRQNSSVVPTRVRLRHWLCVHLSCAQARPMGRVKKLCRNTSPEPYRDTMLNNPCRDRGFFVAVPIGLRPLHPHELDHSRKSLSCTRTLKGRAHYCMHRTSVAHPVATKKNPITTQGLGNPIAIEDSKCVVAHSSLLHFQFPLFLFFFLSFPKHPKLNIY